MRVFAGRGDAVVRLIGLFFVLTLFALPALGFGDDAPAWLRQAAAQPVPTYGNSVSVIVLLDESTMTVGEDGHVTTVSTYAVRILSREGRRAAIAEDLYDTDIGKVREIKAWLIRPSGQVKSYGKDYIIDQAVALNDVYDESRLKKIVAVDEAEPGSVFGYQTISEVRPYFNQSIWYFQGVHPVLSSRLTLTLPSGWRASSVTFNHESVEPAVSGTSYSWQLTALPPIEEEPASPTWSNLAPRIAISYFPTEGTRAPAMRGFDNWTEVSRWYSGLSDPQAVPDDAVTAKARELTAAAKTELDKIRAIGKFVQNIQYISIQIGVGRWRPHAASQVFAKSYGDCKDKANLMRAMLKSLNIESYPVLIFAGDPTYVRDTWPSPRQFNHCIVAVRVNDATQAGTVITHPKLGRLLIFDATDDDTPVGDLPDHEQGSFALVAAGDSGSLERMPIVPPEANALERQVDAVIDNHGGLTASIRESAVGTWAISYRREYRHESRPDYLKLVERWITRAATAARVNRIEPRDDDVAGRFKLEVDFDAAGYGQLMQERLLVFKPVIVSRREALALTDAKRKYPVILESHTFTETVHVKLPTGFEVDEMPDPVKLETPFGTYATTYEVKDGQLVFTRKLLQKAVTIPVDQYNSVRTFFEKIRAAEQAPVVLARK
jgi:transglutaminase-like putative cysteine protease